MWCGASGYPYDSNGTNRLYVWCTISMPYGISLGMPKPYL
nr:MAG TPA: hypothetical protein [Caudoviricetes sp.]